MPRHALHRVEDALVLYAPRHELVVNPCHNRRMSEPTPPPRTPARPLSPLETRSSGQAPAANVEKMICERCGQAEMYRMHAVWRCPSCGFKTDCCGW